MELPVVIDLKKSVMHGDAEIKQLTITREMVTGDLFGCSITNMKVDDICLVASRLTDVPLSVIKQLSVPDGMRVQEAVSGFFEDSQ